MFVDDVALHLVGVFGDVVVWRGEYVVGFGAFEHRVGVGYVVA